MTISRDVAAAIEQRLREMAEKGLTRHEAAEITGWGYPAVHRYAKRFGIEFAKRYRIHPREAARIDIRADEFERRYRNGETLAAIGADFGITRERVRQVLALKKGMDGTDGGLFVRANRKRSELDTARDQAARARWGCSHAEYKALLAIGKDMQAQGICRERTPVGAYRAQKANAARRSIGWALTLWQWWTIWQESGRWEERGRGHGYMMCRKGDSGPYSADNVFIAPGHHNVSCQHARTNPLPIGVSESRPGKFTAQITIGGKRSYLGVYPTPEQAHQAYLSALTELSLSKKVAS